VIRFLSQANRSSAIPTRRIVTLMFGILLLLRATSNNRRQRNLLLLLTSNYSVAAIGAAINLSRQRRRTLRQFAKSCERQFFLFGFLGLLLHNGCKQSQFCLHGATLYLHSWIATATRRAATLAVTRSASTKTILIQISTFRYFIRPTLSTSPFATTTTGRSTTSLSHTHIRSFIFFLHFFSQTHQKKCKRIFFFSSEKFER
jgi:hypothetical protein